MCTSSKKKDIIRATMELVAERGFQEIPITLIAERAGVGAGTIYRYFEKKDMLIRYLHNDIYDRFNTFIMAGYPENRPVRECFFYVGNMLLKYMKNSPLDFKCSEQFYHSLYWAEFRRNKIFNFSREYDFCRDLYDNGREQQIIKNVPIPIFIDLVFAPYIWVLKDHFLGLVNIDDELADIIVSSCWDGIKM